MTQDRDQTNAEEKQSIAFKYGAQAARRGDKLEFSALRNLNPASQQYHDFIAGYDSVKDAKKS